MAVLKKIRSRLFSSGDAEGGVLLPGESRDGRAASLSECF